MVWDAGFVQVESLYSTESSNGLPVTGLPSSYCTVPIVVGDNLVVLGIGTQPSETSKHAHAGRTTALAIHRVLTIDNLTRGKVGTCTKIWRAAGPSPIASVQI
jgi:hypothetical protein